MNINAHDAAVRNRIKQCVLIPSNMPVKVPNTICAMIPKIITLRGLMLKFTKEKEKAFMKYLENVIHNHNQPDRS